MERRWINLVVLSGAIAMAAAPARAGEQITLRNGFEITCHHHRLANNRVRLYTGSSNENYIEVAPGDILTVEKVPDPPPPEPESVAVTSPVASPATGKIQNQQTTVLTPDDLGQLLARAGERHNIDRDLLASVVKAESNGNARAISRAGAQGLMQLMPGTAADLGVEDRFRPEQNVQGGSSYLDALLTRYHDNLALALAAYNAGPGAVDKYHGIPPYRETRIYVARVIHEFNRRVKARQSEAAGEAELPRQSSQRKVLAASAPATRPAGN